MFMEKVFVVACLILLKAREIISYFFKKIEPNAQLVCSKSLFYSCYVKHCIQRKCIILDPWISIQREFFQEGIFSGYGS